MSIESEGTCVACPTDGGLWCPIGSTVQKLLNVDGTRDETQPYIKARSHWQHLYLINSRMAARMAISLSRQLHLASTNAQSPVPVDHLAHVLVAQ